MRFGWCDAIHCTSDGRVGRWAPWVAHAAPARRIHLGKLVSVLLRLLWNMPPLLGAEIPARAPFVSGCELQVRSASL